MAIRKTIQIGHPALKARNQTIINFKSPVLQQVIKDLKDTMEKEELIGMAAPQIAENYQIFVTQPRKTKTRSNIEDKFRIYINPKIIKYSKKHLIIYEGCGSVLHGQLFGPVRRPYEITIEAFDGNKNKFHLRCDGILARVIQHEYDHLFGIEFTEKIYDYKKLMVYDFYKEKIRSSKAQTKASEIKVLEYKKM